MRHTISAHTGLPGEGSYSPCWEVLLSWNKLFPQCPTSRRAHRPQQASFTQHHRHWGSSAVARNTRPSILPFQIVHGAEALAALTTYPCCVPTAPVCALVISAQRIHSTSNNSPGETTAGFGHPPFLHTGLRAKVCRSSHPGAPNTEGTLQQHPATLSWSDLEIQVELQLICLTKACAKHWRRRDRLKSSDN